MSSCRGIFNYAIEDEIVEADPAVRLGRFTRMAKTRQVKGIALTPIEVELFLEAANRVRPEYYKLFLLAVRAGLRRGELVALQFGDIQFGRNDEYPNRYILVQHNYVRRQHTTIKGRKSRRVDMSRELRRALVTLRDQRLLEAEDDGRDIMTETVFRLGAGRSSTPTIFITSCSCLYWPNQASARSAFTDSGEMQAPSYLADFVGGGGQNRTVDLRVMSPSL